MDIVLLNADSSINFVESVMTPSQDSVCAVNAVNGFEVLALVHDDGESADSNNVDTRKYQISDYIDISDFSQNSKKSRSKIK